MGQVFLDIQYSELKPREVILSTGSLYVFYPYFSEMLFLKNHMQNISRNNLVPDKFNCLIGEISNLENAETND